jgi:N-acetylneuraminic acid mutarotase
MKSTLIIVCTLFIAAIGHTQTANYWIKKSDFLGAKRERAVSFSIGDYGYMATGLDTAEVVLNDLWQYDPALDVWTQKANIPGSARRDALGFAIGDKGYVVAGIDNNESVLGVLLSDVWQYDPALNTWLQRASFPGNSGLGIYFATAFTIDSKGYICGGKKGPSIYSSELWEYKPAIDQWTQRASFPGGMRYQLSSFSIGYYGYVGLGATQDIFKRDFWKYSPGTNSWTQIADLPGNERGGATTFSVDGRGFVCLGTDGGFLNDLWEYKPETDAWFSRATYGGSERKNAVSFNINERIFVGTGKGVSGKKASIYEYIPHNFLGVNDIEIECQLFPNPCSEIVYLINIPASVQKISVFTSDGSLVMNQNKSKQSSTFLNVVELPEGIYYINLYTEQDEIMSSHRILILHS